MELIKKTKALTVNSVLLAVIVVLFTVMMLTVCSNPGSPTGPTVRNGGDDDPLAGKLLILQAYGTGDATDGAVSHSFVELYNNTNAAINLTGYSLQYAAGTKVADGADEDGDWTVIELGGSIPAKGSYLVLGQKMNDGGRLQIADNYGDKNVADFVLSNRAFKVALIHSTDKLTVQNPFDIDGKGKKVAGYIDMVGATNDATDQILGYEENPASAKISKQKAIRRTFLTDTNDNSADFESVDYRITGINAEELALKKPKNASEGAWTPTQEPEEQGTPPTTEALMILQFGASTDGAISHSFVELYNNTDTAINLGTYSLQYAAGSKVADNATEDGAWSKINLSGTIQPYHSFLILGDRGTNPEPLLLLENGSGDMNVSFALSNRAVKIALMSNQNLLTVQNPFDIDGAYTASAGYVDMVGAENDATDKIFGYEVAPARLSKQQAPRRAKLTDTNNNQQDFSPVDYRTADQTIPRPRNHANGAWDPRDGSAGKPEGPSVPRQDGPPEAAVTDTPVISNLTRSPASATPADAVTVSATVTTKTSSITTVVLQWTLNDAAQSDITMTASGNVYSAVIPAQALDAVVTYKVSATNNLDETVISNVHDYTVVSTAVDYTKLILNEISGYNKFVEIYNSGTVAIPLEDVKLQRNDGPSSGSEWVGTADDSIPAGAYRLFLFNSYTPSTLNTNPAYVGWTVSSGISNNQILKVAIVDPAGKPVSVFIRGENPLSSWGTQGATREDTYSYSRMTDGTWAYAVPTPGAVNGAKAADIVSPGYLTAQPVDPPVISAFGKSPSTVTSTNTVTVSATITTTTSTITTVVLQWTLNGGAAQNLTMTPAGNVYSAVIPAQTTGAAVSYKVTATNSLGETAATNSESYTVGSTDPPYGGSAKLMILHAQPRGNANGGFANGLVELYNNTTSAIDLNAGNYYLHIGSGTSATGSWAAPIKLTGTIPPQCSYLIISTSDTNASTVPRAKLPTADQSASFSMDSDNNVRAVILRNRSTALTVANPFTAGFGDDFVDMLGMGSAPGYETSPATTSRPQPARRKSLTDTDNNSADFAQWDARIATTTTQLYLYWPRNVAAGPWNFVTGLPRIDPEQ